jgi:hypothetical protein
MVYWTDSKLAAPSLRFEKTPEGGNVTGETGEMCVFEGIQIPVVGRVVWDRP